MENQEQLKQEVVELLNQILLKLDGVGPVPYSEVEDYNGRQKIGKTPEPILDEDGEVDEDAMYDAEPIIDTEVELAAIKDAVKLMLNKTKWSNGVIELLEKYYDSSCW